MRYLLLAALVCVVAPCVAQGPAPAGLSVAPRTLTAHGPGLEAQGPRLQAHSLRPKATTRRPNWTAGVIGAVAGGVAGAAVGCALNSDDYGVFCGGQDDTRVVVSAAIGGLVVGTAAALLFGRRA